MALGVQSFPCGRVVTEGSDAAIKDMLESTA